MTALNMGPLPIGPLPRVVGSLTRYASLRTPHMALASGCDILEVRLDRVGRGHRDWLARCQAIEAAGLPVLLTLRLKREGGAFAGADATRLPALHAAQDALAAIDVEFASPLAGALCRRAATRGKPIVVSHHDFAKTPPLDDLKELLKRMRRNPFVIPKIAAWIHTTADVIVLRRALEACDHPICLIGMGPAGVATRVDFPALGSCLSYGFVDDSAAPGQWPAAELARRLRRAMPAYARDAAARKRRRA